MRKLGVSARALLPDSVGPYRQLALHAQVDRSALDRLLRYSAAVRKILVIFLILLGSVFLTQTVSANVSSYGHCCIAECGDMDGCAVPGCQPCGLHLMASTLSRRSDSPQSTGMPDGSIKDWASWRASVWRPPD